MIGQLDVYGLYLPWLMVLAFGALSGLWVLRRLLALTGFYRWVWHPALFDLALFVLLLYALSQVKVDPPYALTRAPQGAHQRTGEAGSAASAGSAFSYVGSGHGINAQ